MRDSRDQKAGDTGDPVPEWALIVAARALEILKADQDKRAKSTSR